MSYTIEYWTNAPDDIYPTELVVSENGAALVVAANADDPTRTTIGHFWLPDDGSGFEPLRRAIDDPAFAAAPDPGPSEPDSLLRRVTLRRDDLPELTRWASEQTVPDPAFVRAEDEALRLVRLARQRPRRALALDDLALTLDRDGGRLDVAVVLRNPGPKPVAIPAPARWADVDVRLTLTLRRSDVPLAELRDHHQVFVDLGAGDLVPPGLPASPGDHLLLAPSQNLTLTFCAALPALVSGDYATWGALKLVLLDGDGGELLRCELSSPPSPRHV